MDRATLEKLLREQMPLAKAMDVRVLHSDDVVELGCALAPNVNHMGTAFGGSLSALMILAAYCRLFKIMNGQGHVLLRKSSMEFLRPVEHDLRATCLQPPASEVQKFLNIYLKKKLARLDLTSEVYTQNGEVACRMKGVFVGRMPETGD